MSYFKNPKIAALVAACMVVLSLPLGAYRSLTGLVHTASQVFEQGEAGDGFGIANDLQNRVDLSYELLALGQKYLLAEDSLMIATRDARLALEQAKGPAAKYAANSALTQATSQLYAALSIHPLSDADEKLCKRIYNNLTSRNDTISHDPYNRIAAEANQELEKFPAKVFAGLLSIQPAELYE